MAFPVATINRPSSATGIDNGKIPDADLVVIQSLDDGPTIRLLPEAARAWLAMRAAALKEGLNLDATSLVDSYRPYEKQVEIFLARYTLERLPGRPTKVWNGKTYYQRPGTAVAAVPGHSNHGFALAVDTKVWQALIEWLMKNAARFGWSWEIQSEPWHLHYFAGDQIPQAVLDYERALKPTTTAPPTDHLMEADSMFTYEYDADGSGAGKSQLVLVAGGRRVRLNGETIAATRRTKAPETHLGQIDAATEKRLGVAFGPVIQ